MFTKHLFLFQVRYNREREEIELGGLSGANHHHGKGSIGSLPKASQPASATAASHGDLGARPKVYRGDEPPILKVKTQPHAAEQKKIKKIEKRPSAPPPPPPLGSMVTKATGEASPAGASGDGDDSNINHRKAAASLQATAEPGLDSRLVSLRKGLQKVDDRFRRSLPPPDFIEALFRRRLVIAGDESDEKDEKGSGNEDEWGDCEN